MKSGLVILAVIIASFSLVFGSSRFHKGESYPEEYRLEGTTSFSFYFCGHSNTEAAAGLYKDGTDSLF